MRGALALLLVSPITACAPTVQSLAKEGRHEKLVCAPQTKPDLAIATEALLGAEKTRVLAFEIRPDTLDAEDVQVLGPLFARYRVLEVESRNATVRGVTTLHPSVALESPQHHARVHPVVMPYYVDAQVLGAVTGEAVPGSRDVKVTRYSVDESAMFWAVATLGASALVKKPIDSKEETVRHIPDEPEISRAAPIAGRILRLLAKRASHGEWFIVPRKDEISVVVSTYLDAEHCRLEVEQKTLLLRGEESLERQKETPLSAQSWTSAHLTEYGKRGLYLDRAESQTAAPSP